MLNDLSSPAICPCFRHPWKAGFIILVVWLAGFIPLVSLDGPLEQQWRQYLRTNNFSLSKKTLLAVSQPQPYAVQPDTPWWLWMLGRADFLAEVPCLVVLGAGLTLLFFLQARYRGDKTPPPIRQAGRFLLFYITCGISVAIVPNLLKLVIPRLRPRVFEELNAWHSFLFSGAAPLPWKWTANWQSFPSSHTAAAFCMAMAVVYAWPGRWVKVVVFPLAVLVGVSRVLRQMHHPSDIWTGMAVGLTLGIVLGAGARWWGRKTPSSQLCPQYPPQGPFSG